MRPTNTWCYGGSVMNSMAGLTVIMVGNFGDVLLFPPFWEPMGVVISS